MAPMLQRMGYEAEVVLPSYFRGEEVKKYLFTNNLCLGAEFRHKARQIETGRAKASDFNWLLDCASLEWAEARFGWAKYC